MRQQADYGEDKIGVQLEGRARVGQAVVLLLDYSDAPGGVLTPLVATVVPPDAELEVRREVFRTAPACLTFVPRQAGRHLVTIRESAHNRWQGRIVVDVAGDQLAQPLPRLLYDPGFSGDRYWIGDAVALGSASVTGVIEGPGALSAAALGVASASLTLEGIQGVLGAILASSSTTGALVGRGEVAAAVGGSTSLAVVVQATGRVQGTAASGATVACTLLGTGALQAAAIGLSSVAVDVGARGELNGNIAGTAAVQGTVQGVGQVQGVASGSSSATIDVGQPATLDFSVAANSLWV